MTEGFTWRDKILSAMWDCNLYDYFNGKVKIEANQRRTSQEFSLLLNIKRRRSKPMTAPELELKRRIKKDLHAWAVHILPVLILPLNLYLNWKKLENPVHQLASCLNAPAAMEFIQ